MSDNNIKTKVAILDWVFLFSILILLLIVYIPNYIWSLEKKDREESRFRMRAIANAAEFYKELTGNYTDDMDKMFLLVQSARDSIHADSLFTGRQQIIINNNHYDVTLEKGFNYRADTTFTIPVPEEETIIDTIHVILEYSNISKTKKDTNYVVGARYLKSRKETYRNQNDREISKEKFKKLDQEDQKNYYNVFAKEISDGVKYRKREVVKNNYDKKRFELTSNLLSCPLTNKKYILEVKYDKVMGETFSVTSPVTQEDSRRMYLFFKYEPGNHGYINGGISNWIE